MSILTTTARIIRNTFQHMKRNFWHSLTAIMVMTLTLFIASLLGLVLYSSDRMLVYLENKLEVTAFFVENTTEEYIMNVKADIEHTGQAEEVRYISQKEALEIYRQQNQDSPELLEFVTADILPASLSISAKSIDNLAPLAERLANDDRVERVIYQEDVIDSFKTWSARIRTVGIALAGFLVAVSILILLVVVSLNIANFGKEIEIMRLVGASNWYIRWPFLLDGMMFGIISALLSTGVLYALLPYFEDLVHQLVTGLMLFPNQTLLLMYILVGNAAVGVVLGVVGSSLAIFRHLRV